MRPTRARERKLVAVVALLLSAVPSLAQEGSVLGRVTDERGEAIVGAHVILVGTARGDAVVGDGTYRIDGVRAGTRSVRASAVGYESATRSVALPAGQAIRVDFSLVATTVTSGEVIVTAARRAQTTGGVAASVSTMSAREIEMRNAVALDDALRYVPGLQMAGNQVNIRGSSGFSYNTGSRVLLLLDGMPMLRPDVDGIPFDAIPMHQVQRIEVLKGPGSALYGGGALGGIIHVITRSYPEHPETFAELYGGAYEPARYGVWRRQWDEGDRPRPLGGFTLAHARALGERSGTWLNVAYRYDAGHLNLSRRTSLQTFTKFSWRPTPDARLDVLAGANRRKSDSFLFWNGARDALNPGRIEIGRSTVGTGSDDNLIHEISIQPSYSDVLARDVLLNAKTRLFGVYIRALDDDLKPKPLSEGTVGFRYGAEVQLDYEPGSGRSVTVGVSGDANATRSGFFDASDRLSQPEGAAFVQWQETIGTRVNATAGVRFDAYRIRQNVVEQKLSPRLSAAITVSPTWTVRMAYGEGFRVPSVAERYIENSDYLPIVSHVDLLPETSRSFEIGLRGSTRKFPWLHVDGAAFWSDYRRLIEPTFVAAKSAFQFVNLTRARVRGVETTAAVAPRSGVVDFRIGYTYLDARDLTVDLPLVFRSRHLLKASVGTSVGPVDVGADLRYASEPERVDSDFASFVRDAQLIGDTRVIDIRLGGSWKSVRVTLHVKNAFDYYYLERPALLAPQRHVVLQTSTTL